MGIFLFKVGKDFYEMGTFCWMAPKWGEMEWESG
jgi:hypothetical protein